MTSRSSATMRKVVPEKLRRMYLHILENEVDRGKSLKIAMKIAASTVNRYRAKLARGKLVCKGRGKKKRCWKVKGPKLVTRGGTRKQWWPGKWRSKETWVCLKHKRQFRSKAGLRSHYRSHRRKRHG